MFTHTCKFYAIYLIYIIIEEATRNGFDIAIDSMVRKHYWLKNRKTILRSRAARHKLNIFIPFDKNNNDQGLFVISREIELLRYIPTELKWKLFCVQLEGGNTPVPHNGLFSRSLKRRKILRLLSRALRAHNARRERGIYSRTEVSRCEWCLDKFSTKRYTDTTVVLKRASETPSRCKGKKKNYHFIQYRVRNSRLARENGGAYRRTTRRDAIGKRLLTHEHRLSYHFNGILNSRRRVPKLMQSQFPGSCAWYISDFPPLRYRLESSPSHAAVPERLLSPNNRLLSNANWSPRMRSLPRACKTRLYIWDVSQSTRNRYVKKNHMSKFSSNFNILVWLIVRCF